MFIVYDTETTGFPSKKVPHYHPSQARIVQLAFAVLDDELNIIKEYNSLIKPNGKWTITPDVQKIHGFDAAHCQTNGNELKDVMFEFYKAAIGCHTIAAHNNQFDEQMIMIETCHCYERQPSLSLKPICTMELMTPICKLPNKNGKSGFKWPKLAEAYKFVTGKELVDAHDALNDVRGCVELLRYLRKLRVLEQVTCGRASASASITTKAPINGSCNAEREPQRG